MDNKANYTIVGLFIVIMVFIAIMIFLWLTSLKHDKYDQTYITYVREEVSGLTVQSPVRFNGVKVGYVSSIILNKKDPQQVKIVMKLAEGTPVTTSTIASLMSEGITGIDYVGLKALTAKAPLLKPKPGKRYAVVPSEPSLLMKLSTAVQEVTTSISALSSDVKKVFDEENRVNLKNSLKNISTITHAIAVNSKEISHSLQSADKLLKNSANVSKRLPAMMNDLQSTMADIRRASKSVSKAGDSVTNTANQATNAMQGLSTRLVPSGEELLQRLNNLTTTLQQVGNQLQENPAVLVRGKAQAAPGPGEK